jgi:NAD(P)-dependent dehydrogenase (short-subunit alcohol dehydrogenase family)
LKLHAFIFQIELNMNKETVLIFGASGGIGSTLAKKLSHQNKKVILCSRNRPKLEALATELNQPFYVCDGSKEEEVKEVIEKTVSQYETIDAVANCIGSFFIKPLAQVTLAEFNEVLRINLTSCFAILQSATQRMANQKKGAIVLISSCAAKMGLMHHEAIAAAKGAVEALVRSAAASFAQKGVRVNAVAPGLIDTPLASPLTSNAGALKASIAFHPLGRIGSAEDIASAVAWLLSDQSSWVTGEILSVDGGLAHIKASIRERE